MNINKGIKNNKLEKYKDTNSIRIDKIKKKGIYIHIPFCKQKCGYCDFHSFAKIENLQEEYVKALCNEIRKFAKNISNEDKYIDTIFFRRSELQVC